MTQTNQQSLIQQTIEDYKLRMESEQNMLKGMDENKLPHQTALCKWRISVISQSIKDLQKLKQSLSESKEVEIEKIMYEFMKDEWYGRETEKELVKFKLKNLLTKHLTTPTTQE